MHYKIVGPIYGFFYISKKPDLTTSFYSLYLSKNGCWSVHSVHWDYFEFRYNSFREAIGVLKKHTSTKVVKMKNPHPEYEVSFCHAIFFATKE